MFNWQLLLLLISVCIPGIILTVPRSLDRMMPRFGDQLAESRQLPSRSVLVLLSTLQSTLLIALFAALGVYAAPRVGLSAPFFEAIISGEPAWPAVKPQLLPTILASVIGAALFLLSYYGFFRPRMDPENVVCMETLRMDLGLLARLLYGGIAEEVLTRWGLLSGLVWLGLTVFGSISPALIWASIILTGILFGLGHLPSYLAAGCRRTPTLISAMVWLNLWASLIFGWLFWQYGLASAMLAHMLFHLLWFPFDLVVANKP